ncbi:outer membrane beta-barrel family protein [Chitinophaga arvensicola]|uniref:Outer membrane receptor proteins, mostly Fe transport n=1 Tax=Chitinophaga arvensicola TaxID=29529 RepID=A0A1I0S8C4_9BACT|nr:outer membrane beta-barrel family protein [Chitinophaga arvensicola]SEW52229.1 Outer membrane receptor proteins, mostly Fe transport [Chitinophaga arvensicola]
MLNLRRVYPIILTILLIFPLFLLAQQQPSGKNAVTGTVKDEGGKPVPYATLGILKEDGTQAGAAYSGEDGTFQIKIAETGSYVLVISSVGFNTTPFPFVLTTEKRSHHFTGIQLPASTSQLKAVDIVSRKQLIEQKPGMLVYNAENDISNKGGTAADVLRKAPALNVDPQGNVTMRGSGSLKILINGKYSGQIARSPADALNMMPADIIRSVEIITNPSAKYDAEGAAGVINIITKQGKQNLSGALEVTASNWEQAFNPRISMARDKWNMSFHGHLHRLRSKSSNSLERTSLKDGQPQLKLQQYTLKDNVMPHSSAELNIGYTPNQRNEFSFGVNAWLGNWPENTDQTSTLLSPDGTVTDKYNQSVNTTAKFKGADFSLGYTTKFKKSGQELTLLAQFSPSTDRSSYTTDQFGSGQKLRYRELNKSHTANQEWTFQADYNHPLDANGKYLLESGLKSILRSANNTYNVWASEDAQPENTLPQPDRSDIFVYQQNVMAGYTLLKMNLSEAWYVEAGARGEGTWLNGHFRTAGTRFENNFFNFVPTATITRKLPKDQTLTLSYTKRITRPYIWDLNPNANASDPRNIVTGNPQLQPELVHQGELTYSLNHSNGLFINTSLFFKQTQDGIIDFTTTDQQGISTTSKQNLAGNRQFGTNISISFKVTPEWSVNSNQNINYLRYNSGPLLTVNNGWGADVNVNTTYKLPADFSVQLFGEVTSRSITLQGYKTSRYYYSAAVKKAFPANRMMVTLAAINPFNSSIGQIEVMNTSSFASSVNNRYFSQAAKLTFNWEFGKMFEQKDKKKISNDDVNTLPKG